MWELKYAQELIEKWIKILNLERWEIFCLIKKIWGAAIKRDFVYYRAIIYLSPAIPKDELEKYIIHELTHLLVGEITWFVYTKLRKRITISEMELMGELEERVVQGLTKILYQLMGGEKREKVEGGRE